jgi:hypothetical protein
MLNLEWERKQCFVGRKGNFCKSYLIISNFFRDLNQKTEAKGGR